MIQEHELRRETHVAIADACRQIEARLRNQFDGKPLPPAVLRCLKTLQSRSKDLLDTWSPMAGRNILNEMLLTVRTLATHLTGQRGAAATVTALQAWLESNLARHAVTRARYDSVLCLGYKVPTADSRWPLRYRGQRDDYLDMRSRCQKMIEAIRRAYTLVRASEHQNAHMLKIFMAPEFFFRGASGGYDYEVVLGLGAHEAGDGLAPAGRRRGLLELMREEIDKPIYKDWLFVLGTVVVLSQNTKLVCKRCKTVNLRVVEDKGVRKSVCRIDPRHELVHEVRSAWVENVAYVCKESEVYTVSKELIADGDFSPAPDLPEFQVRVRGEVLEVERDEGPSGAWVADLKRSKFKDERMGGCVFTVDGVTFGLELCLDHAWTRDRQARGRLDHAGNIQVQLIPSAGMTINHLETVRNGVVFNVDGHRDTHVQIVGRRKGRIHVFESHPGSENMAIRLPYWKPQALLRRLDPDDPKYSTNPGCGWFVANSARRTNAPDGSIVGYGPFEIPPV